jgi:GT2 family glycosyltransferase
VSEAPAPGPTASAAPARNGLTSVIVVAADSGPALLGCVERVLASRADVEAIVVDNASRDGAVDALQARWNADPRVRVVRNDANLGFGGGCNRGAAQAAGDALLFLNPDCEIAADVIGRLRAASDRRAGILGVGIVDAGGVAEPASRRRDPTLRRALMTMSGLARLERRFPLLAGVNIPPPPRPGVEPVEAVSGALLFMPRAVFERVGGFDEGYFLHAEDFDLCRRVRDAGYLVACVNSITVVHAKGGSSRHRPFFVARHKHRGMWRWFGKFDPAAGNPLLRALVRTGLWLHFAALTPVLVWRALRARLQR